MEHEVYVPFPVGPVRTALTDRERLTRCVPGLQLDAVDAAALADGAGAARGSGVGETIGGRLRVRIGSSTITYRGTLSVRSEGDGIAVEGTGTEARGSGSVKLVLTVVPRVAQAGEGTRLVFSGTVRGDGRLAEFEEKPATAAGLRLLDRFTTALTDSIREQPPADGVAGAGSLSPGIGEPDDNEPAIPGIPGPERGENDKATDAPADGTPAADAPAEGTAAEDTVESEDTASPADAAAPADSADRGLSAAGTAQRDADADADDASDADAGTGPGDTGSDARPGDAGEGAGTTPPGPAGAFEADVPPSSLDPVEDDTDGLEGVDGTDRLASSDEADGLGAGGPGDSDGDAALHGHDGLDGADGIDSVTAEAAHARRTMIGRSAEEVDHAPPRGRYAPVPTQEPGDAAATLRWAAPAAAAVVAGAVVLGRALRRRR